jgi:thioredoxin 1
MVQLIKMLSEIPMDKKVVIDFYADWCKPCIMIAPIYEKLSLQYNDIVFLKVNVDESPEVSNRYNVRSMPTFIFLNNGAIYATTKGGNLPMIENNLETLNEILSI